ncbi:MAG TPA: hypothetical protein VMQ10_08645 [Spirochaetia bacterium]|nr:hypothetical protein [Spirochaetia bacterium]
MKRMLCAAVAIFTCAFAFGQNAAVTLDNQEDSSFYYVVDPPSLSGVSPGSALMASKVSAFFSSSDAGPGFSSIDAGKEARIPGLASGSHLLVGFFAAPDTDDYPVRVMTIQADSSRERLYTLYAVPAQLVAHRGVGKLSTFQRTTATAVASSTGGSGSTTAAGTGQDGSATTSSTSAGSGQATGQSTGQTTGQTTVQASGTTAVAAGTSDSSAAAAAALPTLAAFSGSYDPLVFTRETSSDFQVLPISDSRSWKQTGTRISSVQGSLDPGGFKVVVNVPDGFSPSVSYFLYFFDRRAAGTDNALTLEIEPVARGAKGACILWQKHDAPRLLGTVTTGPASVELDVSGADLSALAPAGASPTLDLTAGWYDKALGMWEEFYYATLTPAAAPTAGG